MGETLKKFLVKLIIYTLTISMLAFVNYFVLPTNYITPSLPYLIPFFFLVTFFIHRMLVKSAEKNFSSFTRTYMLAATAKLLIYFTFVIVYALTHKEDAIAFIITFFILYLLYTLFEVVELNKLKNNTK